MRRRNPVAAGDRRASLGLLCAMCESSGAQGCGRTVSLIGTESLWYLIRPCDSQRPPICPAEVPSEAAQCPRSVTLPNRRDGLWATSKVGPTVLSDLGNSAD